MAYIDISKIEYLGVAETSLGAVATVQIAGVEHKIGFETKFASGYEIAASREAAKRLVERLADIAKSEGLDLRII